MDCNTPEFINITPENIASEHLSCIIRSKKQHPGVEAKRKWLAKRLSEGHVLRKLNVRGTAMIEYAPLEYAWVPVVGDNYIYIYCLWVDGEFTKHGNGTKLMEYCIADAKAMGKSGVCMLGADKQKAWLSSSAFAEKFGVKAVDTTEDGYILYALSFDGTTPRFADSVRSERIESSELTIYYTAQYPFIYHSIEMIKKYCADENIPASFIEVDTLEKAKGLPCVFNNYAVFYNGEFKTVNLLLEPAKLCRILGRKI